MRLPSIRAAAAVAFLLCPPMTAPAAEAPSNQPFTADLLVRLERVSDPRISPAGGLVAYTLRSTDYAANKGVQSIWLYDAKARLPRRLTGGTGNSHNPRWATNGDLYFLSTRSGSSQVWKLDNRGGDAVQVTSTPLDIGAYVLSPDGRSLAVAVDVFADLGADFAATRKRIDETAAQKASGKLFDKLFVRHWDTWADGMRTQMFVYTLDGEGKASGTPAWVTRGIDGDVPSKPFGEDTEFAFSPDGATVWFSARIAGTTEPWSTNFDVFKAPADGSGSPVNLTAANLAWDTSPTLSPDGRTVAYRAMKRATFEADRFGIWLMDTDGGNKRELAPAWDRSADGLTWSADGRTLYTTADELGQKKLFAVDARSGAVKALTGDGTVEGYSLGRDGIVIAANTLKGPTQLYSLAAGGAIEQLTEHNTGTLAGVTMGDYEQFSFKGWNDETVHGYVVKPAGYVKGRKYPVAFLVHGGPQGSMGNHFHYRWNPQIYAGAGFAAVFIDFHGSTGYGQAFTDAISGHWGDRPLEDLQKGYAAALAKYDFLDANRACALGASYGGYMINWIAGNWSQPWKCLVNHDGVFDNRSMAYSTEELWFDEWENQGTQYERPANYEQFNPVNHVAGWRVPMLVVQGGQDFRIPLEQGLSTFTALQRRGIPSRLLYFPDENHWVLKPQNSVQWHETVLGWLKQWTGS